MRYVKYIALGLILSSPALAAENKAMNYYIHHKGESVTSPKASEFLQSMKTGEQDARPTDTTKTDKAASEAWERYKKLAAGTYQNLEETPKVDTPTKPTVKRPRMEPLASAEQPVKKDNSGLAGILDQYHASKEKRGALNTMVINPPVDKSDSKE